MKIFYRLFFLLFCFASMQTLSAQTTTVAVVDSADVVQSRLKFGLGFGLNFVGGTNINLAPNLMYALSNKVSLGVGLQGNYTSIKDVQRTTTIGGNLITQYNPSPRFTTLLELVQLNVDTKRETPEGEVKDSFWDTAIFLGAGLNITDKIVLGAKYNLLYDEDESVYTSPVIPFVNITF